MWFSVPSSIVVIFTGDITGSVSLVMGSSERERERDNRTLCGTGEVSPRRGSISLQQLSASVV